MAGVTGTNDAETPTVGKPSEPVQTAPHPIAVHTVGAVTVPGEPGGDPGTPTEQRFLAKLFSARFLALDTTPTDRLWGWLGPLLITAFAAVLRLVNLGNPSTLVFDETYYVKGAYTLLREGYEAEWPDTPNPAFEAGDLDSYLDYADYVVHPPVGKWMIALGLKIGGAENSWAWRLAPAIVGIIAVWLLARTARKLFGSTVFGVVAGGLMAIDGVAIVHSRTGLLDVFLMFWVVVAFALLVKDREWSRRRLAARSAALVESGKGIGRDGPVVGIRWGRLAAAVALGLACGTKWSGLYFVAVFCVLSVAWDASARRAIGAPKWHIGSFLLDAVPAAASMLPTVLVVYLLSWSAWFANIKSFDRQWAVDHPGSYPSWLPDTVVGWGEAFRSFLSYHERMMSFHTGLNSTHTYMSNPWGWLIQQRPTSFYFRKIENGEGGCGAQDCVRAITSNGNPLIWWFATLAILVALYAIVRYRDWRAVAVLSGILAGWVPWLFFPERTIFTFYVIAFAPWMYLTLTYALVLVWERSQPRPHETVATAPAWQTAMARRRRSTALWSIVGLLIFLFLISAFFYPIWTAMNVPYDFWRSHMWFKSWV